MTEEAAEEVEQEFPIDLGDGWFADETGFEYFVDEEGTSWYLDEDEEWQLVEESD